MAGAASHPHYVAVVERWRPRRLVDRLTHAELIAGVAELLDAGTDYYTAVQTIIPLAATSEVDLHPVLRPSRPPAGDPPAATFLLGFDSAPIRAEKSLYDLAAWTRDAPGLAGCADAADGRVAAAVASRPTAPDGLDGTRVAGAGAHRFQRPPGPLRPRRLQPRLR